ncbi:MAG: hypothetical protein DRO09_01150 [Thermoprotei archaeon]|nr:MAG: hypothetical protein DRO09_01150 [Thermoprotei archaeon]
MKAIVYNGEPTLREVPIPPTRKGEVLGEVVLASLTSIDKAVLHGYIPAKEFISPGTFGVIRVVEVGVESRATAGLLYAVTPLCSDGIPGVTRDGLFREYISISDDCLMKVAKGFMKSPSKNLIPLSIEFSYIDRLASLVQGMDVLVLGCNINTYILASVIADVANITVACLSKELFNDIASLGVRVVNVENVKDCLFDVVIVNSIEPFLAALAPRFLKDSSTIVIPPNIPPVAVKLTWRFRRVRIIRPRLAGIHKGLRAINKVNMKVINKKVVLTTSLPDALSLMKVHQYYERITYLNPRYRL